MYVCVGVKYSQGKPTVESAAAAVVQVKKEKNGWTNNQRQIAGGQTFASRPGTRQISMQSHNRRDDWTQEETFRL